MNGPSVTMPTGGEFVVDGRGPLYRQIKRAIADPILSGRLVPGTRLPSENTFTELFGASRMTVNRALQMLADDGLITRRRRRGTFVAAQISEHSVMQLRDIAEEVDDSGCVYSYQVLHRRQIRVSGPVADHLGLAGGDYALYVQCRHLADERPFVIEHRYINLQSVPRATEETFQQTPPGRWLLENVPWSRAEHVVSAFNATPAFAGLLELSVGDACLGVERTTWQADQPVTYVQLTYPGSRHRLVGCFTPGR